MKSDPSAHGSDDGREIGGEEPPGKAPGGSELSPRNVSRNSSRDASEKFHCATSIAVRQLVDQPMQCVEFSIVAKKDLNRLIESPADGHQRGDRGSCSSGFPFVQALLHAVVGTPECSSTEVASIQSSLFAQSRDRHCNGPIQC